MVAANQWRPRSVSLAAPGAAWYPADEVTFTSTNGIVNVVAMTAARLARAVHDHHTVALVHDYDIDKMVKDARSSTPRRSASVASPSTRNEMRRQAHHREFLAENGE